MPSDRLQEQYILDQINREIEKYGRREILATIQSAARRALAELPSNYAPQKLDPVVRRYIEQVQNLLEAASRARDWDVSDLARFTREFEWLRLCTDMTIMFLRRRDEEEENGGTDEEQSCYQKCKAEYHKCIEERECDDSELPCWCCLPCSAKVSVCVAKCLNPFGGGEIVIT